MIVKVINKLKYLFKLINTKFFYYFFLTKKYNINNWHLYNNLNTRSYKKDIIDFCNLKNFEIVLDYGCGFGDIIREINSKKKYAYDNDPNIVKISKMLFPNNINIEFLNKRGLLELKKNKIDCVLFINFLHEYDEEEVKKIINPYIDSKFILLDGINFNVKGYRYFHDYKFLSKNYNIQKKEFKEENDRSFFILERKYD